MSKMSKKIPQKPKFSGKIELLYSQIETLQVCDKLEQLESEKLRVEIEEMEEYVQEWEGNLEGNVRKEERLVEKEG